MLGIDQLKGFQSTKVATANLNDLINYELSTAEKIRNKLEKLGETSNPLNDAFVGLEKAGSLLTQIKDDRGLPRDVVREQAEAVLSVIQDLNEVLKKLTKRSFGILSRNKLNKEHSYNEELSKINIRLDRVLDQASLHLSRPKGSFSARTEEINAASKIANLTVTQVSQVFETKSAFLGTSQHEQQVMKYAGTGEPLWLLFNIVTGEYTHA